MKIISYGAAEVVTGSCHYLSTKEVDFLVDCGMFQGKNENKNYEPIECVVEDIKFVILTHGHLDHVGRLPLLYKQGFRGVVYATKGTIDIAKIVLNDAANLMEEDYYTRKRKALRRGEKTKKPLYTTKDVRDMFKNIEFIEVKYNKKIKLTKDIQAVFKDAGHILGSSIVKLMIIDDNIKKTITFSGDLGNKDNDILPAPSVIKKTDYLYCESTYGDRNHKSLKDTIKEFREIILKTLNRGGNVIIPSFAIERTQEVLCALKEMYKEGLLPKSTKIFLDSPMAIKATNIYIKYHKQLSKKCNKFFKNDGFIFDFPLLKYTTKIDQSKKINSITKGAIIIAGSGMCNGGRVLHHLKNRIWNPLNSVLFVGYQAEGTLGRKIVDGEKWINIYGEEILIQSEIVTINGFSAHADQNELLEWIKPMKKSIKAVFLIHGEEEKQKIFKEKIIEKFDLKVHIVEPKEVIGV
jgi:metallo-beta-lactamase family protein